MWTSDPIGHCGFGINFPDDDTGGALQRWNASLGPQRQGQVAKVLPRHLQALEELVQHLRGEGIQAGGRGGRWGGGGCRAVWVGGPDTRQCWQGDAGIAVTILFFTVRFFGPCEIFSAILATFAFWPFFWPFSGQRVLLWGFFLSKTMK